MKGIELPDYHVYLLIDPDAESDSPQESVFYVGKGTGARSEAHQFEVGESKKSDRIALIRKGGGRYRVAYVTVGGSPSMTERQALEIEAALIWALKPNLTNDVAGHSFDVMASESLTVIEHASDVVLLPEENAVLVWTKGIRGGTDISGGFIVPSEDHAWENAHGYWVMGLWILKSLEGAWGKNQPVALISLTTGKRGVMNIVNGVFGITGFHRNEDGKIYFDRALIEDDSIASMRERILGQQLTDEGFVLRNPGGRHKKGALEAKGQKRSPKVIGRAFL